MTTLFYGRGQFSTDVNLERVSLHGKEEKTIYNLVVTHARESSCVFHLTRQFNNVCLLNSYRAKPWPITLFFKPVLWALFFLPSPNQSFGRTLPALGTFSISKQGSAISSHHLLLSPLTAFFASYSFFLLPFSPRRKQEGRSLLWGRRNYVNQIQSSGPQRASGRPQTAFFSFSLFPSLPHFIVA